MRIKDEIKRIGYFWLPNKPERKIPGTLSVAKSGDIDLELAGILEEGSDFIRIDIKIDRIIGHVEKDGDITLDNCFYREKNISPGGISKSLICANKLFSGVAFKQGQDVLINSMRFSIEGIDDWIGISGINVENDFEKRTSIITYNPPKEIIIELRDNIQLIITYSYNLPGLPSNKEAKISQKLFFKLVSKEERKLKEFMSIAYKITTFLCFAIGEMVCIESMRVTNDNLCRTESDGNKYEIPYNVYFASTHYSTTAPKIDIHRLLFKYSQIKDSFERVINNWINAYDKFEQSFYLYFSTKMGDHKYVEGKFLALAQGLEAYHRRISTEKLMDEEQYSILVSSIIDNCPDKHKEWITGRLMHGNEISFRNRIKRIIEPFKDLIGTAKERNKLISLIVDTRNYFTHLDKALASRAASGEKLWILYNKIELIFQLQFMNILGFNTESINQLVKSNYQMTQKLKESMI
ncbi:MAG: HEPN domain-containing protein [Candidatus Zixiibacteriota bacterium]